MGRQLNRKDWSVPRKAKQEHQNKSPNKQNQHQKTHKFWPINEKVKQVKRAHALTN